MSKEVELIFNKIHDMQREGKITFINYDNYSEFIDFIDELGE
jgi:hypothetical protein